MRFDVPTIGPATIERLAKAGARALVVEADKTLCLERDKVIALAEKLGLTIVSRSDSRT